MENLCKYGCGNKALDGKNSCSTHHNQCPAVNKKLRGKRFISPEGREALSNNAKRLSKLTLEDPDRFARWKQLTQAGVKRSKESDPEKYWSAYESRSQSLRRNWADLNDNRPEEYKQRCALVSSSKVKYLEALKEGAPEEYDAYVSRVRDYVPNLQNGDPEQYQVWLNSQKLGWKTFTEDTAAYEKFCNDSSIHRKAEWEYRRTQDPEMYEYLLSHLDEISNGTYFKKGWYKGIRYDSSWELAWILFHTDHQTQFTRNYDRFMYTRLDGTIHSYTPDFKVFGYWVEIKGYECPFWAQKQEQFPYPDKLIVLRFDDLKLIFTYVAEKYGAEFYENVDGEPEDFMS